MLRDNPYRSADAVFSPSSHENAQSNTAIANCVVRAPERIGKGPNVLACNGGKVVTAAVNFLSHLAIRERREIRMGTAVRTELDTASAPFRDLVSGHETVRL